jgi:hypothetical protein
MSGETLQASEECEKKACLITESGAAHLLRFAAQNNNAAMKRKKNGAHRTYIRKIPAPRARTR